jgi:hypothetical protein
MIISPLGAGNAGFSASRVLFTFTKLGVVDIIASAGHVRAPQPLENLQRNTAGAHSLRHMQSLSAEEIAQKVGPDYQPQPFFRMLRFAASLGLLEMHDGPLDVRNCSFPRPLHRPLGQGEPSHSATVDHAERGIPQDVQV